MFNLNYLNENLEKDLNFLNLLYKECSYNRPSIEDIDRENLKKLSSRYLITNRLLEQEEELNILNILNSYRTILFFYLTKNKKIKEFTLELLNLMLELNRTKEDLKTSFDDIIFKNVKNEYILKNNMFDRDFIQNLFVLNYSNTEENEFDNLEEEIEDVSIKSKNSNIKKLSYEEKRKEIKKDLDLVIEIIEQNELTDENIKTLNTSLLKLGVKSNFYSFLDLHIPKIIGTEDKTFFKNKKILQNIIKKSIDLLVAFNIKLIIKEVMTYKKKFPSTVEYYELLNVGIEGFLYGVQKFDIYKNIKLSTYVTNWIIQYVINYMNMNKSLVKSSTYYISKQLEYNNLMKSEENKNKTEEEIANMLGLNVKQLQNVLKFTQQQDISIFKKVSNDDDLEIQDILTYSNDENIEDLNEIELLKYIYLDLAEKILNFKEKYIFKQLNELYTNEPNSFNDVASNIYISPERVRQLSIDIENKLTKYVKLIYNNANKINMNIKDYYTNLSIEDLIKTSTTNSD